MTETTHDDLQFELEYWGDCCNTYDEEAKHMEYALYMHIPVEHYSFNAQGRKVVDIGGGPVSMLLKCHNLREGSTVVDPLMDRFPQWVRNRYDCKGLNTVSCKGEDILDNLHPVEEPFDEVWIYNVLQHTEDPALVIENAKKLASFIRIFEWINIPPHEGHPHMLTADKLDEWIGVGLKGRQISLAGNGCYGRAYFNYLCHA